MSYKCQNCDSYNIGWDAWVDENGGVIGGPYDNCQCMNCGSEDITEENDAQLVHE